MRLSDSLSASEPSTTRVQTTKCVRMDAVSGSSVRPGTARGWFAASPCFSASTAHIRTMVVYFDQHRSGRPVRQSRPRIRDKSLLQLDLFVEMQSTLTCRCTSSTVVLCQPGAWMPAARRSRLGRPYFARTAGGSQPMVACGRPRSTSRRHRLSGCLPGPMLCVSLQAQLRTGDRALVAPGPAEEPDEPSANTGQ